MELLERILQSRHRPTPEARVRVCGGFHPDAVYALAGRPLRIVFRRDETAACSGIVVFPSFGKSVTLPPYQDVPVELVPESPGVFPFACQEGLLAGRLIVLGHDHEAL